MPFYVYTIADISTISFLRMLIWLMKCGKILTCMTNLQPLYIWKGTDEDRKEFERIHVRSITLRGIQLEFT